MASKSKPIVKRQLKSEMEAVPEAIPEDEKVEVVEAQQEAEKNDD